MAATDADSSIDQFFLPFDELELGDMLGSGFFGEVMKGTYAGTEVAIKRLRSLGTSEKHAERALEAFRNEVKMLLVRDRVNVCYIEVVEWCIWALYNTAGGRAPRRALRVLTSICLRA